ncbi:HEPN domain-containing protein [Bacillus cereus]|uniref:HEPN domain-containing protein n=1 Tax=Bacillus cereus TaxID=1396 RepID=UPI000BF42E82|nr:HEPN domain-containing protein [Bacillus cereus]PFW06595.1 hypothetical protein COL12_18425 [Bacillus cereus]
MITVTRPIPKIDETLDSENIVDELNGRLKLLEDCIEDVTYLSFQKVIKYYETLANIPPIERNNELYGLTSLYALLLLNATYDEAIKEIFRNHLSVALNDRNNVHEYIENIINKKILNRYMTNIKHGTVKETFQFEIDTQDAFLQQSIATINDLIKTRNDIAHGLDPQSKGHNDLVKAIESVLYYLICYSDAVISKFIV